MVPWTIVPELDMVSPFRGEVMDTANGIITVTLAVAVPPGPVAVIVYVVVSVGESVMEPSTGTLPIP